jgi:hypothetical protein
MCNCGKRGLPHPSRCWPDDQDYHEGAVELRVPSSAALKAYWHARVEDTFGVPPATIIAVNNDFVVRFRVELIGELWHCLHGDWCFDIGFSAVGDGPDFNLSDKLPKGALERCGWDGCEPKALCIELCYTVPKGTIPAEHCGTLYTVGAQFALHCCTRERPILVGYEALCELQFY